MPLPPWLTQLWLPARGTIPACGTLAFLIAAVPLTADAADGRKTPDRGPHPTSNVTVDLSVLEDLGSKEGARRSGPAAGPTLRPPARPVLRAPSPPTGVAPVLEPPARQLHVDTPIAPATPKPAVAAVPEPAVPPVPAEVPPPAPRARPVVALAAADRDVPRSARPLPERTVTETRRMDRPPPKRAATTPPRRSVKAATETARADAPAPTGASAAKTTPAPRNGAPAVKKAAVEAGREKAPAPSRTIATRSAARAARQAERPATERPAAPWSQRTPAPEGRRDRDARIQTAALSPTTDAASTFAPARVTFHTRRVVLTDGDRRKIRDIASRLKQDSHLRLELMAYAAEGALSPSEARRLSLVRALAIRSRLLDAGVLSTRISVRALGGKSNGGPPDRVDLIVSAR